MSEEEYKKISELKNKYEKQFLDNEDVKFMFYVIEKQENLIAKLLFGGNR